MELASYGFAVNRNEKYIVSDPTIAEAVSRIRAEACGIG